VVGSSEVIAVISVAKLKTRTAKDLAAMAKRKGIPGWHSMRKEELIRALVRLVAKETSSAKKAVSNGHGLSATKKAKKVVHGAHSNGRASAHAHRSASPARTERRLRQMKAKMHRSKDLATAGLGASHGAEPADRLLVMVRDSYWLHAYWELTRQSIDRARAAMGQHWHGAKPVLRLLEATRDGTTNSVRKFIRDIEIHGGVNNWYINVAEPPKSYQVEIGYTSLDGKFNSLAKSNVMTTPEPGTIRSFDSKWAKPTEDYDRIFALSGGYDQENDQSQLKTLLEERLRRPLGAPLVTRYGLGAARIATTGKREFCFEVDAELVVYGVTDPDAHVTLRGEPVRLQPDGSFAMRFTLPDRRQVLPVVASSGDGAEQRTIVLAVERNTKVMEPVIRDPES
jgi:hypothetical protein